MLCTGFVHNFNMDGFNSDMEQMKERFAKLLLGEDMSGGGKGVSSALALSNAFTNLAGMFNLLPSFSLSLDTAFFLYCLNYDGQILCCSFHFSGELDSRNVSNNFIMSSLIHFLLRMQLLFSVNKGA